MRDHVKGTITTGVGAEIVELGEVAPTREARIRVKTALANSGIETMSPDVGPSINVWMHRRGGDSGCTEYRDSALDLPIALSYLQRRYKAPIVTGVVIGELSLDGDVRPVRGIVPRVLEAMDRGHTSILVPLAQYHEALTARDLHRRVHGGAPVAILRANTLADVLSGNQPYPGGRRPGPLSPPSRRDLAGNHLKAYDAAAEAIEDGQHVLLIGRPGSGKTMVARRLAEAMGLLEPKDELAIIRIRSAAGLPSIDGKIRRPFRAPHHTASVVALIGGGGTRPERIRPGEVSLAHRGILFLDELPEFSLQCLDAVGTAVVRRAVNVHGAIMPSEPLVIGAMSPCPCGYRNDPVRACTCSPERIDAWTVRTKPFIERLGMVGVTIDS